MGCVVGIAGAESGEEAVKASTTRGRLVYLQKCVMCHQSAGQGTPGVFPPLAASDYLMADLQRSIRILCEGIGGVLTVNGKRYNNYMPPVALTDAQVADVLTFVRNSWGNQGEAVSEALVKNVRAKTRYPTYEALLAANAYAPLPPAPAGWTLREVAQLPNMATRLASDGLGKVLYALCGNGDVWRVDLVRTNIKQVLSGANYLDASKGEPGCLGLALDSQKRFFISVNQRDETVTPVQNRVSIFRAASGRDGDPVVPKPWFTTNYPWGIGPFNHGVSHLGVGPDGLLYVSSGSRTDGNEPGTDPRYAKVGEVELTACVWRMDPQSEAPAVEIFARGLRNAYGFCWNEAGELFATDNGPDADAPEELNRLELGRHYGFPFQFSDWSKKPYRHTPKAPPGVTFSHPVINLGPDGGFSGSPISTFDPHSSPSGIVYLGKDFPQPDRGSFLVARFGNLLETPKDVGFDLLQVRVEARPGGGYAAKISTLLKPLARPIDVHLAGKRKVYLCEYSRSTNFRGTLGFPGRILELAATER